MFVYGINDDEGRAKGAGVQRSVRRSGDTEFVTADGI